MKLASPRAATRVSEIVREQREQVPVADIPGGNHKQPPRCPAKQMAVTEVTILRDNHPIFSIRQRSERRIGRPVPLGKLRSMNRVVTGRAQETGQPRRQLGVDQKLHAAPSGTRR